MDEVNPTPVDNMLTMGGLAAVVFGGLAVAAGVHAGLPAAQVAAESFDFGVKAGVGTAVAVGALEIGFKAVGVAFQCSLAVLYAGLCGGELLYSVSKKLIHAASEKSEAARRALFPPNPTSPDTLVTIQGHAAPIYFPGELPAILHFKQKGEEFVRISDNEFRALRDSSPYATHVELGDHFTQIERFHHGKRESFVLPDGTVLPSVRASSFDCARHLADMAESHSAAGQPAADWSSFLRSAVLATGEPNYERNPEHNATVVPASGPVPRSLSEALTRLKEVVLAAAPYKVEYAYEGREVRPVEVKRLVRWRQEALDHGNKPGKDARCTAQTSVPR